MLSMSSLNMLLAKNDFLPSPLKETYVVSRFLSLLLWFRMPQDLLDLIEMRQRVLNPLDEEFSIFMELLGYLCIKEEEREFQKCSSQFSSVQLLSHVRLCYSIYCSKPGLCPSPTPGVYSNSCPLSWWCHPTISSSAVPFSSCLQFFPASGSFLMSQLFASGGQSIEVSASTSVLPMNTQDWSPLGRTS